MLFVKTKSPQCCCENEIAAVLFVKNEIAAVLFVKEIAAVLIVKMKSPQCCS